ncbi:pentatricopeptide repeat-containing protein At5g55740, chloroplastic [Cynara cardunculus var. scolymus]|uniref:Pentatricopeptide repeat-containing protein n=1 Tax=Cynara cardunculus var. scolymus TaxID=59895 RepID=A0A118JW03_CYNCS|nr:pentatricopeptide repeat-containing protein At5g55740, chloroplastic [Cynara cardunculus var. scolymus]KVH93849.1 Pentatricopeptide repeat-containing protein [Cynara cardunculus var. scolymus]
MAALRFPIIPLNHPSPITKSPKPQTHLIKPQENEKHHQILYNSYFKHISSVCKDGKLQEAVNILIELESQNFQIGADVYGDLLQGCVYDRNLALGKQIHSRIIKRGESLVKNGYIETKLVVFYAKCDLLDVASSLFRRVDERNVFSWAAIIGLYCRMGFLENALLGFCEMIENGFEADNFVVPNVLKACGGLLLIGFGKGVHGYVMKMGFEGCVFVASSLVDMYGKCGAMEDARKVFDKMPERNVVTWNSMMVSYAQNRMYEEAIRVFGDMRTEGIQPTVVTMVSFLSASANLCALQEGKQGHSIAILSGLDVGNNNIMGTSLVNLYSKVGLIEDAEKIFGGMLKKDLVAWNLMVSCYVQHKQIEKLIHLCHEMLLEGLKFDSVTMTLITTGAGDSQNLNLGKEAHCQCIRNNLVLDVAVASSTIDMYAKCNKIHDARRVFSLVTNKDLVLWNTLLAAYAELGSSGETLKLFYQMQLEGVPPNVVSWNSVILALLKNGQVNEAMVSFSEVQSSGLEPNLITHTILILGLVQNGFVDEAIKVFQEMQEKGIKPNSVSIVGVLSACKTSASLQLGRAIHGYILRNEMHMNAVLATSMVDMYAKCGNINQAKRVFDMLKIKELPLYNAMISGYALHGLISEAFALFRKLQIEGLEPDNITFTNLLSLCRHCGLITEGLEIFVDMIMNGLTPSVEHYGCVVSLLSKCGIDEAFRLVKSMPFEPDSHILGSLLASCIEHNETNLAKFLTENLTKMEPRNSGNYVALSNAYAAAGNWDEVLELRSLMREKGIKKSPGCSWVQIGRELHVFVANDRSKSQTEEIYSTLALLRTEMQANTNP